jgi:AmmeMemoRadiSam system protein A
MIGPEQEQALLQLAEASIRHGLQQGCPLKPKRDDYDPALQEPGACFVTLKREGELRGCIGSLTAHRPLVEDVAENAYAAAFSDPRFYPLQAGELFGLELHISLLGEAEPMQFRSENDLLEQLRPGVDGLILEEGFRRGTFLPSVWEQLPEPKAFLHHLKLKAGLPVNYWSATIRISRYTTHGFGTVIGAESRSGLN